MRTSRNRRFRRNGRLLLAVLFIVLAAVVWAECSVSKLLTTYGAHAATTEAQALFAEAVKELCAQEDFSAAVSLQTDENGKITAFSSNAALQNEVQSRLAAALCEAFEGEDCLSFSVPLGTLCGDALTSGRGPSVRFYVALAGSPLVRLSDEFTDAGINQTYHTVTAEAEITLLITALGKSRETAVSLSVPLSQTAVVGDVPQVYVEF